MAKLKFQQPFLQSHMIRQKSI